MYAGQVPSRSGPKFSTGGGSRSNGRRRRSSSSDTGQHTSSTSTTNSRDAYSQQQNGRRPHSAERPSTHESSVDPASLIPYWSAKRHLTCGNPTPLPPWSTKSASWRSTTTHKLKTANAALILCLNTEVDPPDIVKTNPGATLECWLDPHAMGSQKATEAIGLNLQHQYEGLSLKIQYKPVLDPSFEDLRKICQSLRKQAKEDAVLFHYNGHGVPKPTASGELWCFNRHYTQYIPVSLQEIQNWLGSPGVYIWDCSSAGHLLSNFVTFAERRDQEVKLLQGGYDTGRQPFMSSLQLAACAAGEQLPSCPELPADAFTSCLTSPIDIALRYYIMNHTLPKNITADMVMQLPGDLKDRKTPLGELNWIFTAITDTIAWTSFSKETFSRLYRCDLLIASLFRNFLLAERILKNYNCTPHTYPPLPATNTHPLWATWDLAVDTCLRQLPKLLHPSDEVPGVPPAPLLSLLSRPGRIGSASRPGDKASAYVPSRFFADQLTAFEVWIARGGSALTKRGPLSLPASSVKGDSSNTPSPIDPFPVESVNVDQHHLVPRKPPDQLPIVLQVLLSQPYRLRALILLSQFVDLGPWAVKLVLSIGIFPYISRLLQAGGQDLRPVLIFIWARILAVDPSVQVDLFNNPQGYKYFSDILGLRNDVVELPNSSEHQAMCSFILASLARDFPNGQQACWDQNVFDHCFDRLEEPDFLLRQWTALCIGQMWDNNEHGKFIGVQRGAPDKLIQIMSDDSVEVRCAALFALGTFMGASGAADTGKRGGGGSGPMDDFDERTHLRMEVAWVTGATLAIKDDASPMCRKELLVVISCLVKEWRGYFVVCAWLYWEEDRRWRNSGGHFQPPDDEEDPLNIAVGEWLDNFGDDELYREESRVLLSSFFTIFVVLMDLSVDPYHEVATNAQTVVDYIMALLLESPFTRLPANSLNRPPSAPVDYQQSSVHSRTPSMQGSSNGGMQSPPPILRPSLSRNDTATSIISNQVSNTIRRTSSLANTLKSLASGIAFPSTEEVRPSPVPKFKAVQAETSRPPSPNLNLAQYESPYSQSPPSPEVEASPPPYSIPDSPDFGPSHVMEALTEEDIERLRARRRRNRYSNGDSGTLPSPSGSTFSVDSTRSILLGLGTGLGVRNVLPLKSTFFDWCSEYFTEPQMRQTEADEAGSEQYNYQVWRQHRNEIVDQETRAQADVAPYHRWDRNVATIQAPANPLTMVFHSYDRHLVIGNESDIVSVWDWSQRRRLNQFSNGNPQGTSITAINIINQDVGGIIVTGATDGHVRLYRNYDPTLDQGPLQMVSAFRALNEVIPTAQGSGLVMDWKQSSGILLIGGDSHAIKPWDAQTEFQGMDMDTNTDSPVTSICSEQGSAKTFLAGFAEGSIKMFDQRLEEEESIVRTFSDHSSWIQKIRPNPTNSHQFLSSSVDGAVKLWDLRGSHSVPVEAWQFDQGLACFDVHSLADVFAVSSHVSSSSWRNQTLTFQPLEGGSRSAVTIPTGNFAPPSKRTPSSSIPRSTSFVFHPTEMLYGVGQTDGTVRIMGCKLN